MCCYVEQFIAFFHNKFNAFNDKGYLYATLLCQSLDNNSKIYHV